MNEDSGSLSYKQILEKVVITSSA